MAEVGETQTTLKSEEPFDLEKQIRKSEREIGITSDFDRLIEASLFIDRKFLNYALVTGVTNRHEMIFGSKSWLDYLEGRNFVRKYGNQELNIDFIIKLHKLLTAKTSPKISGIIRDFAVMGASYDNIQKPINLTDEELKAIEENPYLTFEKLEHGVDNNTGFIVYPHQDSASLTKDEINKDLNELCEWFNKAKKQSGYNPFEVAALLQQKLISIHPFIDKNGTLSRLLMNWSLENDGESPSIIENPNLDIFTSQQSWVSYVTEGSKKHKELKRRQSLLTEAGVDNLSALFGLGQDEAFYNFIFRYIKMAPPLPINGKLHNHQVYEEFMGGFLVEMDRFQDYLQSISEVYTPDGSLEVSQGGLISPEFVQFVSDNSSQSISPESRNLFFTEIEVYRGGVVDEEIDDNKLIQMFQGFTAIGAGYRSLERSDLDATSVSNVDSQEVQESMDYYNKMFAALYLKKFHPEVKNPYDSLKSSVGDLDTTIMEHISGGESIWNSPFLSTSLNYSVSKRWARNYGMGSNGILLKLNLPREGVIFTHGKKIEGLTAKGYGSEYEALLTGGVVPGSIVEVEVYNSSVIGENPVFVARQISENGSRRIEIDDRRGKFIVRRVYNYNPKTAMFEFSHEEITDQPSSTPVEKPVTYTPLYPDLSMLIENMPKKGYKSPFESETYYEKILDKFFYEIPKNQVDFIKKDTVSFDYKKFIKLNIDKEIFISPVNYILQIDKYKKKE